MARLLSFDVHSVSHAHGCVALFLAGFERVIKHLDGHEVLLSSTHIIKPGDWHKIPNEGMPVHGQDDKRGDLWVQYTIAFPESLTAEQQEQARKLLSGTNMPLPAQAQ